MIKLSLYYKTVVIMNVETTKLELMHLLLRTQKESILTKLKNVFEEEQADWWDEMSKEEQKEIEEGLSQSSKGEVKANKEVKKIFNKWH
jgi:thiamine pyrophosphate-dependent acetolactate synthase large subunit-like protein